MLNQVLDAFNIRPDFDLQVMKDKQTLTTLTSNIILALDPILKELKPDLVLVHGDTTT
jgi:UDP-N-acetylglucosamine 2-epimerase (non-hydrolysing)